MSGPAVVSGPSAAVRVAVRTDHDGYLTPDELRRITALLWDVPGSAPVRIDLGSLRGAGVLVLVDTLARLPCARTVRFEIEAADWRVAHSTARELMTALGLQEAGR